MQTEWSRDYSVMGKWGAVNFTARKSIKARRYLSLRSVQGILWFSLFLRSFVMGLEFSKCRQKYLEKQ